ncbi:MAG: sarcosine oxidase subunit delta [Actinomycetota bacterium]|nr:sarcosine oxidase subunit delta [Actinomycetota bacterium]MDQ5817627.1 sarcosine oxidase subunit delta [Actinomycetota bacterium]
MILIPCPYCGPRNVSEFHYVGEQSVRPDPNGTNPEEWRAFLYLRENPADWTTETWFHRTGCRQHLVVERHTITNEVRDARPPDARGREEEHATGGAVADDSGGGTF